MRYRGSYGVGILLKLRGILWNRISCIRTTNRLFFSPRTVDGPVEDGRSIFYVKDKVDQKEIEIEHMPTEKMWCDVLTKPKQGKGFRVDRSHLMNVPEDYDDEKERLVTRAELLPKVQPITTESSKTLKSMTLKDTKPSGHCRSVLDGDHMTVWNSGASHGRGVTLGRQARVVRARAQNGPTRGRIRGVE